MIEFPCWSCGKSLKAKPTYAGKKCKCTKCGQTNSIPGTAKPEDDLPSEVDYFVAQEDKNHIASVPQYAAVPQWDSYNNWPPVVQPIDYILVIRNFLGITTFLLTIATIFVLVIILTKERFVPDSERWVAFGTMIGLWFGSMVTIANVFLVSEIALSLRVHRRQ